jgi:hypothetical protein
MLNHVPARRAVQLARDGDSVTLTHDKAMRYHTARKYVNTLTDLRDP